MRSSARLIILSALVGVITGLAGWVFDEGLNLIQGVLLDRGIFLSSASPWSVVLLPAAGAGLAAWLALRWSPEALGTGSDLMVKAYQDGDGHIRRRVPFFRGLCSFLTLGSGGSAGKEGPIAQIGAGLGSTLGAFFKVSGYDRRILMLAGVAGGVGAVFKAPLGGALLAAEMVGARDGFAHRAVVPGVISSVTAYSVFTSLVGHEKILCFIDPLTLGALQPAYPSREGKMFSEILHYMALSLLCAATAFLFSRIFAMCQRVSTRVSTRIPAFLVPAMGGALMGALALSTCTYVNQLHLPNFVVAAGRMPDHVMGVGHGFLQTVVDAALDFREYDAGTTFKLAGLLALVILVKSMGTSFTLGSGGSGGLMFPALFLGAITGAAYSKFMRAMAADGWLPMWLVMSPHERAGMILVGMGGVFAALTRAPLASLVLVSEITGSYGLVVPLMLVCAVSYLLGSGAALAGHVKDDDDS
ncbi:MAG: chloride channel protein [Planctomycetota bacterium]